MCHILRGEIICICINTECHTKSCHNKHGLIRLGKYCLWNWKSLTRCMYERRTKLTCRGLGLRTSPFICQFRDTNYFHGKKFHWRKGISFHGFARSVSAVILMIALSVAATVKYIPKISCRPSWEVHDDYQSIVRCGLIMVNGCLMLCCSSQDLPSFLLLASNDFFSERFSRVIFLPQTAPTRHFVVLVRYGF